MNTTIRTNSIAALKDERFLDYVSNCEKRFHWLTTLLGELEQSTHDSLSSPANPDHEYYFKLAREYENFCSAGILDNIYFTINGMDDIPFSAVANEENRRRSILWAEDRLNYVLKNQNAHVYPSFKDNEICVLWFPPYPINLNHLTAAENDILQGSVAKLMQEIGLLVHSISFSELTDGAGFEKWFYDNHFVPNQFNEMLELSTLVAFKDTSARAGH
jgi:hypothetical protein